MARNIKIGIVNYWAGYLPEPLKQQVIAWQATHTDFFVGGPDISQYNRDPIQTFYLESGILYATGAVSSWYRTLQRFCADRGYEFENCLIHAKVDYKSKNPWTEMSRFGWDENANGVIVDNGGTLTDKTAAAYASGVTFSTALYIGSDVPFDQVNFASTLGLTGRWEYSSSVGWSLLTTTGIISFIPPADWTRISINGSWAKYFVRFVLTADSSPAIIGKITGDNWRTNTDTTNCRGWDATSPTIINSGELAYNPTPPAHATAKFKQQSRITGAWAAHTLTANIGYKVGDVPVWATFIGQEAIDFVSRLPTFNGVYYDDMNMQPKDSLVAPIPTGDYTDYSQYTSESWDSTKIKAIGYVRDYIKAVLPNFNVGTGSIYKQTVLQCDWVYGEMAGLVIYGSALPLLVDYPTRAYACYDWAGDLAKNLRKSKIIFAIADHVDYRTTNASVAYTERGNRGPMSALASHLLGANEYTYLHYYTFGGWRYGDTDDIYVFGTNSTTLTQPIIADVTANIKHIYGVDFSTFPVTATVKIGNQVVVGIKKVDNTHLTTTSPVYFAAEVGDSVRFVDPVPDRMSNHLDGKYPSYNNVYKYANYFPAMFVDIGVPDPDGWNGGIRGSWFGIPGSFNILRRDYTYGIVLFREIYWSTPGNMYSTFGESIPLDGTFYKLNSDGTFSEPITEISLRCGEGVVLFKHNPLLPDEEEEDMNEQLQKALAALVVMQTELQALQTEAQQMDATLVAKQAELVAAQTESQQKDVVIATKQSKIDTAKVDLQKVITDLG